MTFLTLVRPFVLRLSGVDKVRPEIPLLRADYEWAEARCAARVPRADERRGGRGVVPSQGSGVLLVRSGGRPVDNPPGRQWRGVIWCASFRSPSC